MLLLKDIQAIVNNDAIFQMMENARAEEDKKQHKRILQDIRDTVKELEG